MRRALVALSMLVLCARSSMADGLPPQVVAPVGQATKAAVSVQSASGGPISVSCSNCTGGTGGTGGVGGPVQLQDGTGNAITSGIQTGGKRALDEEIMVGGAVVDPSRPVLQTGANKIGQVAIDQSTPGTSNNVQVSASALPANAATSTLQNSILAVLAAPFQVGGSIGNSSFGISGNLPSFAITPTFNLGTLNGAATSALQSSTITAIGSPFQAGASIGNSGFSINGTLPAFASVPTFNLGTIGLASSAANQTNGAQQTQLFDGTTVIGTTAHPVIVAGSGTAGAPSGGVVSTQNADPASQTGVITAQDVGSTVTINTPVSGTTQTVYSGTSTAGSCATFNVSSMASVRAWSSGSWTGTLTAAQSSNGGTSWVGTGLTLYGTLLTANGFAANFIGGSNVSDATQFRICATAVWTGTATIGVSFSNNASSLYLANITPLATVALQTQISAQMPAALDGSGYLKMHEQGTASVSAASLPLPAGAASLLLQQQILAALASPFQAGGSIGNTAFGISGTLPAFATTPTFNLGTGSIANTAFGISGTLPAFAATPTFNLGSGSIGNTSFGISGTLPAFTSTPTFFLGAGSALAGKFGIDQTTAGTTNGVVVNSSALPTNGATSPLQTAGNTSLATIATNIPAQGQALAANSMPVVLTAAQLASLTPPVGCAGATESSTFTTAISILSSTQVIAGVASQKIRICALDLVSATAENIALTEGTGTTCATGTAGLGGGSTPATGWNFSANGGLTKGNGQGLMYRVATTADNVCLLVSGSGQVTGSIVWMSAP